MSLKHFHLVFMASAIACMTLSAQWGRQRAAEGDPQTLLLAASVAGLAACVFYLRWFVLNHRTLK